MVPGSMHTFQDLVEWVPAPAGGKPAKGNVNNFMGFDRTEWKHDSAIIHSSGQVVSGQTIVNLSPSAVDSPGRIVWSPTAAQPYTVPAGHAIHTCDVGEHTLHFLVEVSSHAAYAHQHDGLDTFLDRIGTSGCVSLLQKIVRRRPQVLTHPNDSTARYTPTVVIARIVQRMCTGHQSGLFLPNLGIFVPAFSHFCKRLFIIAAEDSYYEGAEMFYLAMHALLSSHVPYWKPPQTTIDHIVHIASRLYQLPLTSTYDSEKKLTNQEKKRAMALLPLSSFANRAPLFAMMHLGGMGGDKRMLLCLQDTPSRRNIVRSDMQPSEDSLAMYCDQHQEGRVVCLLPPSDRTFSQELGRAFYAYTGRNSRRAYAPEHPGYIQAVKEAVAATDQWTRLRVAPTPSSASSSVSSAASSSSSSSSSTATTYQWTLPECAIAGMVGQLKIENKFLVTVSGHDTKKFVVIWNPSRSQKKTMSDITPDVFTRIVDQAKHILSTTGVRASNVIDPGFHGKKITWRDGEWYVGTQPWEDQRQRSMTLAKPLDWSKLRAPHESSWPWSTMFGEGQTFRPEVIDWCVGRMAGYNRTMAIPKISRTGTGTHESLTGLEAAGYQYLYHLSQHFPDAIHPGKLPFTFDTKCLPLRLELRARLRRQTTTVNMWQRTFRSENTLKPSQALAVQQMEAADDRGLASFLWMLVGQGKTLTVLTLLSRRCRCKYVLWALPPTALGSVQSQIEQSNWQVDVIHPGTFIKKGQRLREGRITIVFHDDLRKIKDQLAPTMGDTFFVFDEVHKVMQAKTQRTAAALRLARIAKQLVALTGTPIVDSKGYGLMQWLRLCVEFPVTNANFWVAANSMISELNTGEVTVCEMDLEAPVEAEERAYLRTRFPTGLRWEGTNPAPTPRQWKEARDKTMDIVDRELVRRAMCMYQRRPIHWKTEHATAVETSRTADCTPETFQSMSQRPLIVAATQKHAAKLVRELVRAGMTGHDIVMVGGTRPPELPSTVDHFKSIHLTEENVLNGHAVINKKKVAVKAYQCAVASIDKGEGYSLTWMTCMLTGVYPSNPAKRTQMAGRINRLDAQRLHKWYFRVVAGVTAVTVKYQDEADRVERALRRATHH